MLCSLRAYRRSSIRLRTVALSRPELGASKVHVPSLSVFYRDISSQKSPKNTEIVTKKAGTASIQNKAISLMKSTFDSVVYVCRNPGATWQHIKDEVKHYWLGTKLLWSDVKIAKQILTRLFLGHGMTRRERMQLIRTTTDIFRLVPFSIFIIVPFMELLLPFALKIFPNMLPSTFQDSLRKEESMKQELQMRLAVAKFMQETLQEMAEKKSSSVSDEASGAREVIDFIEQARLGSHIPNETVVRIARLFKDELTLANVPRPQLVSMCRYMGLPPYGGDAFLRFQLRSKFRVIQDDDRRILWEGIDTLNTLELRDACRDRGMRSLGIGQFRLRNQLQEWLDLSTLKSIPISLLIMSRALMLSTAAVEEGGQKGAGATTAAEEVLKSSMSSLDQGTINEVVLAAASPGEKDTPDIRKRMLESLEFQKEMIAGERLEAAEALIARHSIPGVSSVPPSAPQTITASVPPDSLDGFASATATVDQLATTSPIAGSGVLDVSASPADESPASAAGAASAASASGASSPTHTRPDAANCAAAGQPGATDTSAKTTLQQQQQQQQQQQKDASSAPNEQQARTAAASAVKEGELPSSSYEQPPVLPATAEQQELTVNELIALSDLARGSVLQREMSELAILEAYLESLPLDAEDSVEEQEAGGVPQQGAPTPEHSQQQHFQQPETTVSSAAASGAADPPHDAPAGSTAGSTLTAPSYRLDPDAWVQNKTDKTPEKKAEKKVDKNVTRMRSAISSMLGKLKVQINTTEKALGDRLKLLDKDGDGQISAEEIKEVVSQVLKRGASATDGDGNQNAVEVQGLFDLIDSNKDGKVSLSELLQFIQKKRESMEVEALEARMRASQVQPQDPQQAPSAVTPAQRVEGCTATSAGSSHSSSSIPSQQLGSDSDTVKDTDTVSSPKT